MNSTAGNDEAIVIELAQSPPPVLPPPRRRPPSPPKLEQSATASKGLRLQRRDTSTQTESSASQEPSMDSLLLMIEQQRLAYEDRLHQVSTMEVALAVRDAELKKRAAALDEQEREISRARRQRPEWELSRGPVTDLPWAERVALAQAQITSQRTTSSRMGDAFTGGRQFSSYGD